MEIIYLKEFTVLAEIGSYSKAAKELHISQPVLSRHIQMLEKELEHPLFIRSTRRMELSPFGERFLLHAKKLTQNYDEAMKDMKKWEQKEANTISIGSSHMPHLYSITETVIGFRKEYPELRVRIIEKNLNELMADYEAGDLNLVTMAYGLHQKKPEHLITAGKGRLVCILPKDHILAGYRVLSVYHLEGRQLLLPADDTIFSRLFLYVCHREGIQADIVSRGGYESNLRMLKSSMGIMIDDETVALSNQDPDTVIRPITPEIEYEYGLLYRERMSRNEKLFCEYVRSVFEK